jgi:hypothetical protein
MAAAACLTRWTSLLIHEPFGYCNLALLKWEASGKERKNLKKTLSFTLKVFAAKAT